MKKRLFPFCLLSKKIYGFCDENKNIVIEPIFDYAEPFVNTTAKVIYKGRHVLIDKSGNVLNQEKYTSIWLRFDEGYSIVIKDRMWGIINNFDGKEILPPIYDKVYYSSNGLTIAKKNKKYGILDSFGEIVVPFIYSYIERSKNDGLFWVLKDYKYGIIDNKGEVVIPFLFDKIGMYRSEHGVFEVQNYYSKRRYKLGFVSKTGEILTDVIFDNTFSSFQEGLLAIKKDEKWGFINKEYKIVIPFIYDEVSSFSEGLSAVKVDSKWKYINRKGEDVLIGIYDYASSFSEGKAFVIKGFDRVYIDKKGVDQIYLTGGVGGFFKNNIATVSLNNSIRFIDVKGKVITLNYDKFEQLENGLIVVEKDSLSGLINETAIEVTPLKYNQIEYLVEDLIKVRVDEKYGCVNLSGDEVIPVLYDNIICRNEFVIVVVNGKIGFYDYSGSELLKPKYDGFYGECGGLYAVGLDGKVGLIDKDGNVKISFKYDADSLISDENVKYFPPNLIRLKREDVYLYIDVKGEEFYL